MFLSFDSGAYNRYASFTKNNIFNSRIESRSSTAGNPDLRYNFSIHDEILANVNNNLVQPLLSGKNKTPKNTRYGTYNKRRWGFRKLRSELAKHRGIRRLSKNYYNRQHKYSDLFPSQIRSQTPHLFKLPYTKKYSTNLDYKEFRHSELDYSLAYTYNSKNNNNHRLNTRLDRSTPPLKNLSDAFSRSQKKLLPIIYNFNEHSDYNSIANDSTHYPNRVIPDLTIKFSMINDSIMRASNRNTETNDLEVYDGLSTIKSVVPGIKNRKKKLFKYKSLLSATSSFGGNLTIVNLSGAGAQRSTINTESYQNLEKRLTILSNRTRKYAKFQNPIVQITRSKVVILENKIRARNALIAKRSFLEHSSPINNAHKAPNSKILDSTLSVNTRIFSNIKEYGQLNNRNGYINS